MNVQNNKQKSKFKIAHSLQELEDQLILTLKDKPLLKDNKQVNDDQDLFQNQQLQTINRTKHNAQLKKRIKELSDVTTSHIQGKNQGKGGILPHYDDYSYKNQQIQVQQDGFIKNKRPKSFKNTSNDFLTKQQSSTLKLGAEYNAPKIKRIPKKSNLLQQNKASQLLSFLNETAEDNIVEEPLKRGANQAIQEALDSWRKKRILQFNAKKQVQSVDISSILGITQQQQLLNKSIGKAQKRNKQNKNFLLQAIKEQNNSEDQNDKNTKIKDTVQIQLNPISYRGDDKRYSRKDFDVNGMKSGITSAMFVKLPSQRLVKKQQADSIPQSFKDITPEQLQKMRQQVSFLEDKAVGTGLAGTLQYLRQNSLIKRQQQVGRTTDKSLNINDPNDRIKLQYRNSNGKLMKPKQAFRYLCATFHGQGPGKNKVQKRKKRELQQLRMKERENTDGQLLNMLNEHQRKNNQAYMVIDIGKKANFKNI